MGIPDNHNVNYGSEMKLTQSGQAITLNVIIKITLQFKNYAPACKNEFEAMVMARAADSGCGTADENLNTQPITQILTL